MKGFLTALSSSGRFHEVQSFSFSEEEVTDGQEKTGMLTGSVQVRFLSVPEKTYANVNLLPIFGSGKFETEPLDRLLSSSEQLPALPERNGQGRANPFVL
jgi:hypothetical protein